MSERCEAKGCWANSTGRVRVKRGDVLSVCDTHASILVAAGEVVETLPSFADVAQARQGGRPPVPIPDATLAYARQLRAEGKGLRAVAQETGIERNTLRRRLQVPVVEPLSQPVEVPVSQPLPPPMPPPKAAPAEAEGAPAQTPGAAIQQAALYLSRAALLEKKGRALLQEAEALVAKAKAALDIRGG